MVAAAAIYREMYGSPDNKMDASSSEEDPSSSEENKMTNIPATFQLLYFIGWKPHPSQVRQGQSVNLIIMVMHVDLIGHTPSSRVCHQIFQRHLCSQREMTPLTLTQIWHH